MDHYLAPAAAGENPAEVILAHTVQCYGLASLEQAESAAAARARKQGSRTE
jgi:hypothetical protein